MDLSQISSAYTLVPRDVRPSQLLLDPRNPRISLDTDKELNYTDRQLATPEVQRYIYSVINKAENHIQDLIKSISTLGFVQGWHDIIVRRSGSGDTYLVLEGNRRLTAIKHLLSDGRGVSENVRRSLEHLQVKEFIYKGANGISQESAIEILLGTIHLRGVLEWGAMEKARFVYRTYMLELGRETGDQKFEYSRGYANIVADFFAQTLGEVRKSLMVYRVFDQLRDLRFDVKPKHFTLIELAVKSPRLRDEYFEMGDDFCLTKTGMERFRKLCLDDNCPIHNPQAFQDFKFVFANGSAGDVESVELGRGPLSAVRERVEIRANRGYFLRQVEAAIGKISELTLEDYQRTSAEKDAILELKRIVDEELVPIARVRAR